MILGGGHQCLHVALKNLGASLNGVLPLLGTLLVVAPRGVVRRRLDATRLAVSQLGPLLEYSAFQRPHSLLGRQVFSVRVVSRGVLVEQRSLHADAMHRAVRTLQFALCARQRG